ncbi:MAG: Rieske 2Fe-2S domain-containing protein [Meiothermus sp.]|uniref:Rieske 2Fe-2S domain-containing protein n=1 Tax=Meiothermus sp. TaxID=1955249 RepID=UPI0025FB56C6|nr:Rieske 2Fe-2S domain-containing protein [Meiothermus sp.]MCS7067848.1 Rieske 2Fe-2S domain-containing protein [Meiothermus sp.]MDW8424762.1 Rieske 2Fe-2S domain-containing protein [Meiothermus sp.]
MDRRDFLDLLAKGTSLGLLLKLSPLGMLEFVRAQSNVNTFQKALLVDKAGNPFKLSSLKPHEPYVFAYPFAATPNILVNVEAELAPVEVKMPDGKNYRWTGGVGKGKNIVAYTSICPHAYSYAAPNLGAMGYYKPEGNRGPRMVCCAHLSAFDLSKGGEVKGGPAPHALAAVALEYDAAKDEAYAVGFLGNPQFDAFFRAQNQALRDLFRTTARAREEVAKATVIPYTEHTKAPTTCPVLG